MNFFIQYPALIWGLSCLIGTSSPLFWNFPWNGIWPFLWGLYLIWYRRFPPFFFLLISIFYGWMMIPTFPSDGTQGYFSISILKPHQSPFEKSYMYKGTLYIEGQSIPCTIMHKWKANRPQANSDYLVQGTLKKKDRYQGVFQAKQWIALEHTWSFAELRFQMKEKLRHLLEKNMQRAKTATFLGSLLTGDVEERSLRYELGRLGLQHLLAVSGFHFAILISFFTFFFSCFLPPKGKYLALLFAISAYFLFVGPVPAVQRSWMTASCYLIGKLFKRNTSGLNLLGASMTFELLCNPLISSDLGFQLSFLSCAGILLLSPLFQPLVEKGFPKHNFSQLTLFSQHGYLLLRFLRQSLILTLGVNTAIFPLLLYHFHTFPLLSFLYNLFFPFLVSLALFILLLTLLIHSIYPPLASWFFSFTDFFTAQILDLIAYPPLCLDHSIRVYDFPSWIVPLYLFALFSFAQKRFFLTNTPILAKIQGS